MNCLKKTNNQQGFLLPFVLFIFFLFTLLLNTVLFLHTQKIKQYHQNILFYQGEIALSEFIESYPNLTISNDLLPFIEWHDNYPKAITLTFKRHTYQKSWEIPYHFLD